MKPAIKADDDDQHDAHVLAWARSNYRSCDERRAKWEWREAKRLAGLEKKRKKYGVDIDTLTPELRAVVHEYGWLPPGVVDVRKVAQAMRIARTSRELRSQEDADEAYRVLKWYFRGISDIPEVIALLEPLKKPFKRRM